VNDNEWQHHFETNNYKSLKEITIEDILQKAFLKIAAKISLQQWNNAEFFFTEYYVRLLQLLSN